MRHMLHAMGKRDVGSDAPTKVFLLSINVARRDVLLIIINEKVCDSTLSRLDYISNNEIYRRNSNYDQCRRNRVGTILLPGNMMTVF